MADSGRPWKKTSVGAAVVTGHGFSVHERTHETVTMQREACHRETCAQKLTAGESVNAAWGRRASCTGRWSLRIREETAQADRGVVWM